LSTKQVLIINSGSNSLSISEGDAEAIVGTLSLTGSNSGVIDTHIISTNANGAESVTTADLDGDGDLDVLSASAYDDKIAWYENDGNEVFTEQVISTNANGARSVTTADLDGDGDLDVLSASAYDNKIAWYENDGNGVFTEQVISTNVNEASSVTTADVDDDGDLDVLSASSHDDKIAWYENEGNGVFTEQVISTNADRAKSVTTDDVDGDGDLDVLSASAYDDKIVWYENDGNQGFTEKVISTNANNARSVTTADLDGDGDIDVLSASWLDDKIAWYENDGNQRFTEKVISTNANGTESVTTADLDGDGDLDVLSASAYDDKIAWYENNGNEVFTEQVISTNTDWAKSVTTADLDGDGDLDVLSASFWDDKIVWYDLNLTPQFTLSGEDADQFEIVDQELKLKTGVVTDYETKSSYSVTVIATDPDGTDYSKDFDITIKDIAETPTGINFLDSLSGAILHKSSSFSDNHLVSQEVPIGNSVLGSINFTGDTDWFSVELEKGSRYQIDWDFMGDTSITESPELKLYDSQGLLVPIEIGEKGFTCRLSQSGDYYLSFADNISNDVLYDYSLSIGYEKFTHAINITNPSLFGSYYDDVVACLDASIDLWAEEIVQTGVSSVVIDIDVTAEDLGESTVAQMLSQSEYKTGVFYGIQNISKTVAQLEIASGIDKNTFKSEGFITVNTRELSNLWFDPTPTNRSDNAPTSTKYDFISTMLHELGHVLGVHGFFDYEPPPSGIAGLVNNDLSYLSIYDTFIDWDDEQSSFVFTGENAVKAYQELGFSGNLPLHSEGNDTSDLSHYGSEEYDSDPLDLYLMDATSNRGKIASISTLDTAILKDLGYRINESEKLTESIVEVELQGIPIVENIPGVVVAVLETVDADINDPHVYTLSGIDAVFFEVSGQQLKLKEGVDSDYETKSSYDLTITTTDSSNLSYSEDIIVEVVNVSEGMPKTLSGTSGNDTLDGFSGYYTLDGKGGLDVAKYSVVSDAVSFSKNGAGQLVLHNTSNSSESDILVSMERIQFTDKNYALDLDGNTGIAAKAIIATFGADKLSTYMSAALSLVDEGTSLDSLCDLVIDNSYIENLVGSTSNGSFVDHVYENVVGISPSQADHDMFTVLLDNGTHTKSSLLSLAANTTLTEDIMTANLVDIIGVPGNTDGEMLVLLI
jgi:hypothetical protein